MNNIVKGIAVVGLSVVALGTTSVTASASSEFKSHQPVPRSFRGTWYSKRSLSKNSAVRFTTHTFTTWSDGYKSIGTNKMTGVGHQHGHTYIAGLYTEHSKGSAWYAFEVGRFFEVPGWRYTHAHLRKHGKVHRYPALERSYSHYFGKHSGKNVYFFKAGAWK
ncbi:hypothetical protein [Secundilactobacillus folii]|uniref:Uncharacterized protein n=1 Tax=Secundilactobacillus folii TaxID=2678357 RepID=A0A7X2XW05_9LACO|nr:hypothetical protein [Secundilactobacillus folii]MTV82659.1 hypothetical protein [Secundilactobacillus folii]